ncbi:MAG: HIT domain-containing protein [Phycisphaerales bacterium]|jgi:histidine triad (HIT) family protein|nr:HIT domain-containing protein [Phycisphaerales bacterium]
MTTIFEKILDGEIPCHKVYEDEHVLAFLDVAPLSRGHVLVIPRESAAFMHDLSEESGAALGRALVKVASAVVAATGAAAYNILQNNGADAHQAVFHVHFHIIPKYEDESGLQMSWKPSELADGEALALAIQAEMPD